MKQRGDVLTFSATDLSDGLGCEHLSQLEHQVEVNGLDRPKPRDPMLAMLAERGRAHERAYLEHLRGKGLEVIEARASASPAEGMDELRQLMHAGVQAIYQATLADERGVWSGRADFLLRVERPTRSLGAYGYEVVDTKLARDTRAGAILQLCLYTDLVEQLQGEPPENMYIVTPVNGFTEQPFRVADFMAYYRRSRTALIERLGSGAPSYPEPVERCDVCRFWEGCEARWRRDDHLSLVADISRTQRAELMDQAIHTLQAFAEAPAPLPFMPKRGSRESLARVHKQAQLQLRGRLAKKLVHELVGPIEPGRGLCDLPEPSTCDLFLELEGDPFNGTQGLEYLFGWVGFEGGAWRYEQAWARDALEEKRAFERFMQVAMARLEADGGMHIYHYGAYEQSAFKRLSSRYGSYGEELNVLLRGHRFVDLHRIVKQGVVASVESYSIKRLEPLIGFARQVELREVGSHKRGLEGLLQLGARDLPSDAMEVVRAYNEDDCRAAQALRDWLERERGAVIADGTTVPRPTTPDADAPESVAAWLARIQPCKEALLKGLPVDKRDDARQQARWLLAHMLGWHKREENCSWWERFRLRELEHEELLREPGAITGLRFEGDSPPDLYDVKRSRGVRFSFPVQQLEVRRGDELLRCVAVGKAAFPNLGEVLGIDASAGWVDVKVSKSCDPSAVAEEGRLIRDDLVSNKALGEAIAAIAERAVADGLDVEVSHPLAAKLLMRVPMSGLPLPITDPWEAVHRLQGDVLPVQGPPGAGKSYAGARMIMLLHHAGKKVGVTANSHAVIEHLMRALPGAAADLGVAAPKMMRVRDEGKGDDILPIRPKDKALKAFNEGKVDVLGGTAWFWASPAARDFVHTLVIDEAGQMSLANAVACSPSARNLILLGDPQQLAQPIQASHPEGLEVSALQHLIGVEQTLPPNCGLFLKRTFRMHPHVCRLISELYYGGLLGSEPGLEHQRVEGVNGLSGSGLRLVQVPHEGNTNRSVEEVEQIVDLVNRLVQGEYVDSKQVRRPLTRSDILIVAPFNAQVHALREKLPGMSIGTVDRFQGQEAPVVIYGMTTSSAEDAPRGMSFLYDSHRFNVAISRARALAILVVSPALLHPRVKSPEQMRLANALAHYVELAESS